MKFGGENKKCQNIKNRNLQNNIIASELSLERMWKRISEFILKIDEDEFKKTIDGMSIVDLNLNFIKSKINAFLEIISLKSNFIQ